MKTATKNTATKLEKAVEKYLADLDFYENRLDAQEPQRHIYGSDAQHEKYHSRWRAQKAQKPEDPRPMWEKYFAEKAAFENRMNESKPARETFATDEAFEQAQNEWRMALSMDAPNEPGYFRANND